MKRRFFSSVACHPHVSGENGHRKPVFSKTLSRVEIFENAGFSTTCRRTKTEVFQYGDVIHHNTTTSITHALWGLLWYFHRFSVFWWMDQNVSNTLRVDVNFFGHVGKNLRFQKYPVTCGRVLSLGLRNKMFVCRNYFKNLLDLKFWKQKTTPANCGDLRVVKAIVYVLRFLRILSLHDHGFFVLLSWLNRTVFTFKKYHFGIKLRNCYIVQVSRNVTAKNESNPFFFCLLKHKGNDYTGSDRQVTQVLIVKQILLMSTIGYV